MLRLISATVLAASVVTAAPAVSAPIITPVSVEASNEFPFWGNYRAINMINGSGLTGDLHDGNWQNMWMTDLGIQAATLLFDLGGLYTLSGVNIWNYNADFGLDRGVKDFTLELSVDGVEFSEVISARLDQGTGQAIPAQSFALNGQARYVRLNVLNNYGDQWSPVGLSEVNFTAVPEPMPVALLGAGLLGIAFMRRRSGSKAMSNAQ